MEKKHYYLIAGIVLVIFTLVTGYFKLNKQYTETESVMLDTSNFVIDSVGLDTVILSDNVVSNVITNKKQEVKYHIIVGSFKNIENAKNLQYVYDECKILPITDNEFHCVSVAEYNTYELAQKKLLYYRSIYKSVWILKQPDYVFDTIKQTIVPN